MSKYYTIHTSKYNISDELQRYLQALCGRYDAMKEELKSIYSLSSPPFDAPVQGGFTSDTTQSKAVRAIKLQTNINAIDSCINKACENEIGVIPYLKQAVTHRTSYNGLGIVPESKDKFFARRRYFYYLLAQELHEI